MFTPSAPLPPAACPRGVSVVLDDLHNNVSRDNGREGVRLGVLLSAVGRTSYGPLLIIIGLFSVSPATILPGMTSVAALITLLIALQMAIGVERPWLPRRALLISVPRGPLFSFLDRARPRIEAVDGVLLRERWSFFTLPVGLTIVSLCVIAAALITLPLSVIPFAPLAPGLAVLMFGLGITARDGVLLALGMVLTLAAFLLAAPVVL